MVVSPYIFQVVGYQDSGKTTTMVKIIEELEKEKLRFVTIKHHGHGGKPDVVEKDSTKHNFAGGLASLVEGGGRLLLQSERLDWSLTEQIELCTYFKPEVILIEGYKHAPYPKIVLIRDEADEHLLTELTNLAFVLYWKELSTEINQIPDFPIREEQWLASVIQFILNKVNK